MLKNYAITAIVGVKIVGLNFHKTIRYKPSISIFDLLLIMATSKDPLHGKTLETILIELVSHHGWKVLGEIIKINCFNNNPGIKSSLTFLRKTPWARKKVEELYIKSINEKTD